MTPTVLIHDRPATGLEGKFSMQFCAAAALVNGEVALETFEPRRFAEPRVHALVPRVAVRVDPDLDRAGAPLTHATVAIRLVDGRVLTRAADGARGYPERPASQDDLRGKFVSCATRALEPAAARDALARLDRFDTLADVRELTVRLTRAEQAVGREAR